MVYFIKAILVALALAILSACSGDEETGVADAINQQSQIIENQNARVNLYGSVVDLGTEEKTSAQVRIKVGSIWMDAITNPNGDFEFKNLTPNSNFQLVVESSTEAFLPRVLYGITRASDSGSVYQDLGAVGVSEGMELFFSVLDQQTDEPVTGLTFTGSSAIAYGSGEQEYLHRSEFHDATGNYSIIVPKFIPITLSSDLDLDRDGASDYRIHSDRHSQPFAINSLVINTRDLGRTTSSIFWLSSMSDLTENIQLRVTVLDTLTSPIPDLVLYIEDEINGSIESRYDAETQQYVFDAKIYDQLRVMLPAFSRDYLGEIENYRSASVRLSSSFDDTLRVSVSDASNNNYYQVPRGESILNLVVQPLVTSASSLLEVVAASETVSEDYGFKVFYSNPVTLVNDSVQLFKEDVVTVTRGNDSDNDLVLPGITLIQKQDQEVESLAELSLNDTLLSLLPASPLEEGKSYRYEIGDIIDQSSQIAEDIYGDVISFETALSSSFDISDLVLDNQNYTTNGLPIILENTAGVLSNASDRRGSVSLFFPPSVKNLNTLTLVSRTIVENGIARGSVRTYDIVQEGTLNGGFYPAVSLAINEDTSSNTTFIKGSTLEDLSYWRELFTSAYLSDNTASQINTISFEYMLERKNGDIETGSINLPVR